MNKTAAIALAFAIQAGAPALAQEGDYQQRLEDLVAISTIFGELHHIRRQCEPRRESDIWRERMKTIIELEGPQGPARERMVSGFNKGYRTVQNRFDYCDRRARDYAARRASQGDAIIATLMAPLYEAVAEDGELPQVWRGSEGPVIEIEPN